MENTRRVFIAIDIPTEIKAEIKKLNGLIQSVHSHPMENFHITVKFIGEAADEQIPLIASLLDFVGTGFPPFPVQFKGFKVEENRLRLLVANPDKVLDIHKTVDHNLKKILTVKEDRIAYQPHITLGRMPPGEEAPYAFFNFDKLNYTADRISLFETVRGEKTATFVKLKEVFFTGE